MDQLFSIQSCFGYSIYVGKMHWKATNTMLDWVVEKADTEIWLAGRLYIVISNERYYKKQRDRNLME